MRLLAVFTKTMRELARDWKIASLTFVFPPFFLVLYWMMSAGGTPSYTMLVCNLDAGAAHGGSTVRHSDSLLASLNGLRYASGAPMVTIHLLNDTMRFREKLTNREAAIGILFESGFSNRIEALHRGEHPAGSPAFAIMGDAGNMQYPVASILVLTQADSCVRKTTGERPAMDFKEIFIGSAQARTEFDAYVPGLLVLSVIMVLFTTAIAVVREMELRTMLRLRISSMTAFDFLGGITLAQTVVGLLTVGITFAAAAALGFKSEGPILLGVLVAVAAAISTVAVGVITACFCKTSGSVLTVGTFPFFLLMWFTGAAYPLPRMELFSIGGRTVAANDVLAPTHAVIALNKIFATGADFSGVAYELAAIGILTVLYFAAGVWLFNRVVIKRGT